MSVTKPYLYFSPSAATFSRVSMAAILCSLARTRARNEFCECTRLRHRHRPRSNSSRSSRATRNARNLFGHAHRLQHMRRPHLAGRTRRARTQHHAVQIERHHCGFRDDAGQREIGRVGQARRIRAENDRVRARVALVPFRNRRATPRCAVMSFDADAAAPKPAMPDTFSVPARRLFSCPPPRICAANGAPVFTINAPTPCGPPSLWADSDI